MTKLMRTGSMTLARALVVCAPVLALGACAAPPPPCDACAIANQALSVAQQAAADARAAREAATRTYSRGLVK